MPFTNIEEYKSGQLFNYCLHCIRDILSRNIVNEEIHKFDKRLNAIRLSMFNGHRAEEGLWDNNYTASKGIPWYLAITNVNRSLKVSIRRNISENPFEKN